MNEPTTIEELHNIVKQLITRIDKLENTKKSPAKVPKAAPKNIIFEDSWAQCINVKTSEEVYPCMYLRKSGTHKGTCCGLPATVYFNDDLEKTTLKGIIEKEYFHSLRCPSCENKGHANSESKKKCLQKIKGVDVKKSGQVDTKALDFLAGSADGMVSPTRALSNSKPKPSGDEYIYDDHIHYLLAHDDNKYIFEYAKNKNNTPNQKKTPTLRGYVKEEDFDKDTYNDNIKTSIKDEILEKLKEDRKYFFDGQIIKEKKEVIVPTLEAPKKEEVTDKELISEDAIDEILNGIKLE